QAGELSLEVVEGRVERGARGLLGGREPPLELVERPRVVAGVDRAEPREGGGGRFVVARDRRGPAEPRDPLQLQLHLHDLGLVLRRARDREGRRERERDNAGTELHAATLTLLAARPVPSPCTPTWRGASPPRTRPPASGRAAARRRRAGSVRAG